MKIKDLIIGREYCGLSQICVKKNILIISHTGNMGNSIKSIDRNLKIMKLPVIADLKKEFKVLSEEGSPDYMYEIKFKDKEKEGDKK